MRKEDWIKHDKRSRNDGKMRWFMKRTGQEGYGTFWSTVETLTYQRDLSLPLAGPEFEGVADDLFLTPERYKEIIQVAIQAGLFQTDGTRFWQDRLKRDEGYRRVEGEASKASMSAGGRVGGVLSGMKRRGATDEEIQAVRKGIEGGASTLEGLNLDKTRVDKTRVDKKENTDPEGSPSPDEQPIEVRPHVFLTEQQVQTLQKKMNLLELNYWLDTLTNAAQQNPKKWKKQYSRHDLVVLNWRKRALEDGKVWNPQQKLYLRKSWSGGRRTVAENGEQAATFLKETYGGETDSNASGDSSASVSGTNAE